MGFEILKIRQHPELKNKAAEWFSGKWDIPVSEYSSSMEDCIQRTGAIPQWYVALCGNAIAGGYGVIENDFHVTTLRQISAPSMSSPLSEAGVSPGNCWNLRSATCAL